MDLDRPQRTWSAEWDFTSLPQGNRTITDRLPERLPGNHTPATRPEVLTPQRLEAMRTYRFGRRSSGQHLTSSGLTTVAGNGPPHTGDRLPAPRRQAQQGGTEYIPLTPDAAVGAAAHATGPGTSLAGRNGWVVGGFDGGSVNRATADRGGGGPASGQADRQRRLRRRTDRCHGEEEERVNRWLELTEPAKKQE
ncbi:hypothetical protein NKR19_g5967 [Coniochaeta hoffmannii]|uniref:Uncharacterized protein n=1 Tax=Coniochaeta hoffmannii TaxID=91930 RepID=A0AA38RTG0_9PEZI|nr:hypothetical protein NKR19_g5967 [Coniochaeta hoffmannii]